MTMVPSAVRIEETKEIIFSHPTVILMTTGDVVVVVVAFVMTVVKEDSTIVEVDTIGVVVGLTTEDMTVVVVVVVVGLKREDRNDVVVVVVGLKVEVIWIEDQDLMTENVVPGEAREATTTTTTGIVDSLIDEGDMTTIAGLREARSPDLKVAALTALGLGCNSKLEQNPSHKIQSRKSS
jgi:hypothetical protein